MANRVRRCLDRNRPAIEIDFARLRLGRAEQGLYKFRAPRANESGKADNLTTMNAEADIVEFPARR